MKSQILICLILFCYGRSYAQECKDAFYFSENKTITITRYDKNGITTGKDVGTVTQVTENGGVISANYNLVKYDVNNKIKENGHALISCNNGDLKIGFQVPDMENGTSNEAFFSYPANMKPGQALEAKMEMRIKGKVNGKKTDVSFKIEDRKVWGQEKVSTPAGTYNAFKLSYNMDIRIKVVGIGIPMKVKVLEWYSPGVGVIKTESFNKDGQLEERSVLSSIK
jgi:hypothetical protein